MSGGSRYSQVQESMSLFEETKEESHLRAAFHLLDLNGDGLISREELLAFFKSSEDDEIEAAATSEQFFVGFDTNQDGFLQEDEFVNGYRSMIETDIDADVLENPSDADLQFIEIFEEYEESKDAKKLQKLFKLIDTNNDGVISKKELESSFLARSAGPPTMIANRMMALADKNHDGVLTLEEFQTLLENIGNI